MSKAEEREALEEAITEDNARLMSLGLLLQLAEPSMNGETRDNPGALKRLMYDVGAIIRDYTDRISSALSDLEFLGRDTEEGGKAG